MTSKKRTLSVALAGLLVLSSVAAAGLVSAAAEETADGLAVAVENVGNDGATVTVTQNDSAVANASVTVVATNNSSYADEGSHVTDANGTVSLAEPAEDVTVEVTAEKGNLTGETTATLTADEGSNRERKTFGDLVSSFVHQMLTAGDDDGSIGQVISEFVTSNNPGKADEKRPDHAGKPADASAQNDTAENGTDEEGSQGPPEHAGNDGKNDDENDDETTTTTTDDEEKSNNGRGNGNGR